MFIYNVYTFAPLPPSAADMEVGSDAIKNARGLAFLTTYTVGFFGGGTFSHGILIAKKPGTEAWGLPVAISGGGATAMFGLGYREDTTVRVSVVV